MAKILRYAAGLTLNWTGSYLEDLTNELPSGQLQERRESNENGIGVAVLKFVSFL